MLLALAIAVGWFPTPQDEGVALRWTFVPGEVLRYRMTQRVSTEANGVPIRQELSTTLAMEVRAVDAQGKATLRTSYEAVAVRASGVQESDYDSQKDKEPPDDPAARLLSKLVGQSFTMTLGEDGKVVDIRGYDALLEAMLAGAPGDGDPAREKTRQALAQSFSDESFRSRMQQFAPPLPQGKVKKGETWLNQVALRLPLVDRVTYQIRSRLAEVKDGQARIEQEITVEFNRADNPDHPLAGQIEAKEAKGRSTCLFTMTPGRFASQKAAIDLALEIGKTKVPVHLETEFLLLSGK